MGDEGSGRKRLGRRALMQLKGVELGSNEETFSFGAGPLGLQIIHVADKGVLVWFLEGQALEHKGLCVGAQVVEVAGKDCRNADMQRIFELVTSEKRPVQIRFRLPKEQLKEAVLAEPPQSPLVAPPNSPPFRASLSPVEPSIASRLSRLLVHNSPKQPTSPTSARSEASAFSAGNSTVSAVFQKGSLGLEISDVGKRVLVTKFVNNPDGSPGQAEANGLVHFGYQVIRVGKVDVEGMTMLEIGEVVSKQPRPLVIEFRILYERERGGPVRAQKKRGPEKEEQDFQGDAGYCSCSPWKLREDDPKKDPMWFHFQMLCNSFKIKAFLESEPSEASAEADGGEESMHPAAYGLMSSGLQALYRKLLGERVPFPDWPSWIRAQVKFEGIGKGRQPLGSHGAEGSATDDGDDDQPKEDSQATSEHSAEGQDMEECAFCRHQRSAVLDGENPDLDDMFVHFFLLFRSVYLAAEKQRRKIDQEAYLAYLAKVDVNKLYQSCNEDKIPLHEWTEWITKQCNLGYEEDNYVVSLSGDSSIDLRDMIKSNQNI